MTRPPTEKASSQRVKAPKEEVRRRKLKFGQKKKLTDKRRNKWETRNLIVQI